MISKYVQDRKEQQKMVADYACTGVHTAKAMPAFCHFAQQSYWQHADVQAGHW